jgi:hypothetical protein
MAHLIVNIFKPPTNADHPFRLSEDQTLDRRIKDPFVSETGRPLHLWVHVRETLSVDNAQKLDDTEGTLGRKFSECLLCTLYTSIHVISP